MTTISQLELIETLQNLVGPGLATRAVDVEPGAVIISAPIGGADAKKFEDAGYRVVPSGPRHCIVYPKAES